MQKHNRRLAKLEQGNAAERGTIVFTATDDGRFVRWRDGAPVNYRYGVNGVFGADTPAEDFYTQAQIDELQRQGYQTITVIYTKKWRASDQGDQAGAETDV